MSLVLRRFRLAAALHAKVTFCKARHGGRRRGECPGFGACSALSGHVARVFAQLSFENQWQGF